MGEVLGLNTVDNIINSIYIIRGQQVMLDSDLAKIEAPVMSDLEQVLDGMEGGADLALRLRKRARSGGVQTRRRQ